MRAISLVFTIDSIRSALSKTSSPNSVNSDGLIEAAVAILVYPKPDSLTIILNKRTDRVEHHKGEISFPGGGRDPEDDSILDTALRETREEMGIAPEDIEIIAQLDQVSTRSGFSITPFVGIIPPDYDFEVSNIEIAEVLEVPIESLLDTENQVEDDRVWGDEIPSKQYSYLYGSHIIWGATARIITQLLDILKKNI
ncbi:MAG: CoA pyrophosphatase [SAR202 cluster bacterium]|nr:CoA pyrophosphatase [SAR202 cluster bacterium]